VAEDRVAAAVAELYGADPDAFTERRKALVAAAREAGDKQSAAAITALRKPTRAAWVVNRLARADPDAPVRLAAMAAELRDAERAKDGPRLRELSAARGALIDALTAQALAAAGVFDPPSSLRDEVTSTLTAALADPATAAGFAAGSLTKAAQWSGFGYADLGPAGDPAPTRPTAAPRPTPVSRPTTASPLTRLPRQSDRAKHARTGAGQSTAAPAAPASARAATQRAAREQRRLAEVKEQEQERLAAQEQRLAQEAADRAARAARAREKYEDAERTLAQASTAAAEASAVEDRLEAEVRQLEERLTQAREELASARLRARRAEAAESPAPPARVRLPGA